MLKDPLALDIDGGIFAIWVHDVEGGPPVPENPLRDEIKDIPEEAFVPSPNAARARMRTAKIVCLRRHGFRQQLNSEVA